MAIRALYAPRPAPGCCCSPDWFGGSKQSSPVTGRAGDIAVCRAQSVKQPAAINGSSRPFARLGALHRLGYCWAGQGLPTRALLDFQFDHARVRDAVHAALEPKGFTGAVGRPVIEVHSYARTRDDYLKRPDLGRVLDAMSVARLPATDDELAIIVADGLARAVA